MYLVFGLSSYINFHLFLFLYGKTTWVQIGLNKKQFKIVYKIKEIVKKQIVAVRIRMYQKIF